MPINEGIMSSARGDWETPKWLFDFCNHEAGGYNLDAAASEGNHLCEDYFSLERSAFDHEWSGNVWLNPPYGRGIERWIDRAIAQRYNYQLCSLLVPARTDTQWWKTLWNARTFKEVTFFTGRLKFTINGVEQGTAPFPSALITLEGTKLFSQSCGRSVRLSDLGSIRCLQLERARSES